MQEVPMLDMPGTGPGPIWHFPMLDLPNALPADLDLTSA